MKFSSFKLILIFFFYSAKGEINTDPVEESLENINQRHLHHKLPTPHKLNSLPAEERGFDLTPDFIAKNTRFLLWNRGFPTEYRELIIGNVSSLVGYRRTRPTKIYSHGFNENGYNFRSVIQMRDAYLKREGCNFISVDWERLARFPFYIKAAVSSVIVGQLAGQLINFLVERGADLNDFHFIGFSMGAHIAGNAGATVNGILPRITGLDPAFPFFSKFDTDQRLDITDAAFVDVMHTNSGTIVQGGISYLSPIGDVDFYVGNGGRSQPGCGFIFSGGIVDYIQSCSHTRAFDLFTESINSKIGFKARVCQNLEYFRKGFCSTNKMILMGDPTPSTARGTCYLSTNSVSPFAQHTNFE